MSQSTLNGNSYERQSALKASITLESAMIQAGLLKPESLEDAFQVCETYYTRFLLKLTEGVDTASAMQTGYKTPTAEDNGSSIPKNDSSGIRLCTEKQRKALYAISKHNPEAKLTKDTKEYTFNEASEFIERYGKK